MWSRVVLAACAAIWIAASARADVIIEDGDFLDWSETVLSTGGSDAAMTIHPTGGNPGAYLESETVTGSLQGVHHLLVNDGVMWAPGIDGEILDIAFEIEHRGGNQGIQLLLVQDGHFYIHSAAPGWPTTGGHADWTSLSLGTFVAEDFVEMTGVFEVDVNNQPDFSATGSPLQFGFAIANSSSGTVVGDYDNWQVSVTVVPAPSTALLAAGFGLSAFGRRRRG